MLRLPPLVFAIAILFALGGCAMAPIDKQSFAELETPHFDITSSLGPTRTLELAGDLEAFFATVEFVAGVPLNTPGPKIHVFAFDGRGPARKFGQGGASSYFLSSLDGGTLVLRTGGGWDDATKDLRHELTHQLLRNHYGLDLPLWYDEGVAVYASTIDIGEESAEIGAHRRDHLVRLRTKSWISLHRVLESEHTTDWSPHDRELFDSQAWAVIHSMNAKDRTQLRKQLTAYLADIEDGVSPRDALKQNFDTSLYDFQKDLQRYVRQDRLHSVTVKLNKRWQGDGASPKWLTPGQVNTELGWLSLVLDRPEQALEYFDLSTRLEGSTPRNDAGIGQTYAEFGKWQEAKPYFERALATGPEDPRVQIAVAQFYVAQAEANDDLATRKEIAERGLPRAERALALDPGSPSALGVLATLQRLAGQVPDPDRAPAMLAIQRVPASIDAELLLARHHLAIGHPVQARQHARNAYSRTHSKNTQQRAKKILQEIDTPVAGP